jgi:hypothetical protein
LAIVDVTLNAAMVLGPQLTVLYEARGAVLAFGVAAAAAGAVTFVSLALEAGDRKNRAARSLLAASTPRATDPAALPRDAFLAEMAAHLANVLLGRNYEIDTYRAQSCVREILDSAFPYLAPGGPESADHMRDVGRLMASLGHDDWAAEVRDKFDFPTMRRRPRNRFSHDISAAGPPPEERRCGC